MANEPKNLEVAPVEPQKSNEDLEKDLEKNVEISTKLIGIVDITQLFRKHTDTNYAEWIDLYQDKRVQKTMSDTLIESGCSPRNVGDFINALGSKIPDTFRTAHSDLTNLVKSITEYKKTYDESKKESKEFKADMIFDSVKHFLHAEIVEGMNTNPLMTMAKCGVAGVLIWKLWSMAGNAKKWIIGGAGVVAGAYILNGVWPHLDSKERKLTDYVFGAKSVDSQAYRWFLKQAKIENNDKIDAVFAISDFKIDKLVALYRNAQDDRINIDDLIDSTTDTDTIEKLQSLNTYRMQKSLYTAIASLIQLGGYDSPGQMLAEHSGAPLRSVVLSVYAKKKGSYNMAEAEKDARQKSYEKRGMMPDEQKVKTLLEEQDELGKDIPEAIKVEVRDGLIWVDSYPYKYKVTKKTDDRIDTIELQDIKDGKPVTTLEVSTAYTKEKFVEALGVVDRDVRGTNEVKGKVQVAFEKRVAGFATLLTLKPIFNSEQNEWSLGNYKVQITDLGLDNPAVPLQVRVSPDGYLNIYSGKNEVNLSTPSDFDESLIKPALVRELSARGPAVCRNITDIEVKKYDKANGTVEAKIMGVTTTLEYKNSKYLLTSVDWKAPNNAVLEFYKDRLEKDAKDTLDEGLKDIKMDEVSGFPVGYRNEFNKLKESKATDLGTLYKSNITGLKDPDIEGELEKYEKQIKDDLAVSAKKIDDNYHEAIAKISGSGSRVEVSEEDFKTNFLDVLQTAGLPNAEYKAEYQKLIDESFHFGGFGYSVILEKYSDNFYEVKNEATRFFFEKTGQFALKDSLDAKEKGYIEEKVAYPMNQSLREAFMKSNWIQDLSGAVGSIETTRPALTWVQDKLNIHIKRIGISELNWHQIEPYSDTGIYESEKVVPPPSETKKKEPKEGGDKEKKTEGGGEKKEKPKSAIDDDPSTKTKELVWAEYENYINSQFNELEKKVDKIVYIGAGGGFVNLFGFKVTNEAEARVLFKALINTKKREFLDKAVKGNFDKDYDGLYVTWEALNTSKKKTKGDFTINEDAAGNDINPIHVLSKRYFEPMNIDLQTMSTWLESLGKSQGKQPTVQDYDRVVEKFISSKFGKLDSSKNPPVITKEFELFVGIPPVDLTLDTKAQESRANLAKLEKQKIVAEQALNAVHYFDSKEKVALNIAQVAYETELKNLSTITSNLQYSGLQNLYKFYVRSQVKLAQEKANGDESKYVDYFAGISSYEKFNSGGGISDLGNGWTKESLLAVVEKTLEDKKDELKKTDTPYDLEQFMSVRYKSWANFVQESKFSDGTPYSPGIKFELLNQYIDCEDEMLNHKRDFWETINSTSTVWPDWLESDQLAHHKIDLANYEKALHTSLMEERRIPLDQKVIIYRESLNYTLSVLQGKIASDNKAFKARLEGLIDKSVVSLDSIHVVDVTNQVIEKIKD